MTAQTTEPHWIPTDTFGSRLFHVRREMKMTVEQIAKLCNIAQPTWTTWENGARPRDLVASVRKIADATGCDKDWLMWGGPLSEPGGPAARRVTPDPTNGGSTRHYLGENCDFLAAA